MLNPAAEAMFQFKAWIALGSSLDGFYPSTLSHGRTYAALAIPTPPSQDGAWLGISEIQFQMDPSIFSN